MTPNDESCSRSRTLRVPVCSAASTIRIIHQATQERQTNTSNLHTAATITHTQGSSLLMATTEQCGSRDLPVRSMRSADEEVTLPGIQSEGAPYCDEEGDVACDVSLLPLPETYAQPSLLMSPSSVIKQHSEDEASTATQTNASIMEFVTGGGEDCSLSPTIHSNSECASTATTDIVNLITKRLLAPTTTTILHLADENNFGHYDSDTGRAVADDRDDTYHQPFLRFSIRTKVGTSKSGEFDSTLDLTESESSTPTKLSPTSSNTFIASPPKTADDYDEPTDEPTDDDCSSLLEEDPLENGIPRVVYFRTLLDENGPKRNNNDSNNDTRRSRPVLSRLLRPFQKKKDFFDDNDSECYRKTLVAL